MKRAPFPLLILVLVLFASRLASATTVVLPSDESLVTGARAIARGTVLSIVCAFDSGHTAINTYITLKVEEVYKGKLPGSQIVLKEPGGIVGTKESVVFGTPDFTVGEDTIVYLDTWPDGSLRVYQMLLGKFSVTSSSGPLVVGRDSVNPKAGGIDGVDIAGSASGAITNQMRLVEYAGMVRRLASATSRAGEEFESRFFAGRPLLSAPPEFEALKKGSRLTPQFHIFFPPARFFEPDSGKAIAFAANSQLSPSPTVFDDIRAAMKTWSSVDGSLLNIVLNPVSNVECIPYAPPPTIVFDDCDGRYSPSPDCTGVLAIGGFYADATDTRVVNETTFRHSFGGFISFNPFSSCYFSNRCNVQEIITHEMGHVLGLHHSWQPGFPGMPTPEEADATMYFSAHFDGRCSSLRTDDINGITFLYPGAYGDLAITTPVTLPGQTAGTPFTLNLSASGETPPYSWSVAPFKGALPPGLALSSAGTLSGIPTAPGAFKFAVQVVDSASHAAQQSLTISIAAPPLTFASAALPAGAIGLAYNQAIHVTGGVPPYRWAALSGSLPGGLALGSASGAISGAPTATGVFHFTVQVADQNQVAVSQDLSLTVVGASGIPQIATVKYKSANGKVTVTGSNFDSAATLLIDGQSIPIRNQSSGILAGKIPALAAGSHPVNVVNSNGISSAPFLLQVN